MIYVFIDESGDLGFKETSSRYYVIASVETKDESKIRDVFKKIRKKLGKKKRDIPEFKFSKTNRKIKLLILSKLSELDLSFSAVVLRKESVYPHLRNKQQILHNYITGFIVEVLPLHCRSKIQVVVDKFLSKESDVENFNRYLEYKIGKVCNNLGIIEPSITISHESSQRRPGLQAADFVAGAIFNRYERNVDDYYNLIKPKIKILKERF
ncbi:conserved hypothetical protein [Ferroglobus placidus DSM 10642]|uniref:DUF3800 domain-containing protein n=1 Tax=Ferroglobus placidus (strain DSM 10642 / AEDII12DO) TaxID=589924 RepID=D3S1L0_FERPA|nr:DUF3800 domain-containing protein [Ferroglobus placidus]ADC66474.1 conserved hypothetical protein [Ferroglobus placidus DSM 10642]